MSYSEISNFFLLIFVSEILCLEVAQASESPTCRSKKADTEQSARSLSKLSFLWWSGSADEVMSNDGMDSIETSGIK